MRRTITFRRSSVVVRSTKPRSLEPVDAVRDRAGGDHRLADEVARGQLVGLSRSAERREDVVHPALDAVTGEVRFEPAVDEP